jgi:hypothetical protein
VNEYSDSESDMLANRFQSLVVGLTRVPQEFQLVSEFYFQFVSGSLRLLSLIHDATIVIPLQRKSDSQKKGVLVFAVANRPSQGYTPLSKPFKSKKVAEKEREKYSEKKRRRIGLGLIRVRLGKK